MSIRGLLWLALLFVVAAVCATLGRSDAGHVLIIYPPYRVDVSLNLCVIAFVVAFIVLYAAVRVARNIVTMPRRMAAWRARARAQKARAALRDALGNLYAGRFARAEKAARAALADAANRGPANLIAAQAAHEMHEYARRDEWLEQIDHPDWQEARLMTSADLRADARDAQGALAALAGLRAQGSRRIRAQQIALRVQQQLKNWSETLRLTKALEKRDALHPAVAARLRQIAAENLLRERRHHADALLELWRSLSPVERHSPRLADLAAQLLVALERPQDARRIVEEALAQNWDARLLRRYPDTAGNDALPLIQKAEGWRGTRPDDADLLFTLGRLCLAQRLWGKAQSFLEAALKAAPGAPDTPGAPGASSAFNASSESSAFSASSDGDTLKMRTYRSLARLYEELGDEEKAAEHYRQSAMAMKIV